MSAWASGRTEAGYGAEGIILTAEHGGDGRVVSLAMDDGKIILREECDGFFAATFTPAEAKAALREAIEWIDAHTAAQQPR